MERKRLRETKDLDPEQLAELRDKIGILEEMTHRLGVAAAETRLEARELPRVRLISEAKP